MTQGRRHLAAACSTLALLVLLSGCGGEAKHTNAASGGNTPSTGSTTQAGNGSPLLSEPITHKMQVAHVDLLALNRTSATNVAAKFRIVNDGTGPMEIWGSFGEEWMPWVGLKSIGLNFSGVVLLDALHNKVYYPSRTPAGDCLCTDLSGRTLQKGQSLVVYAVFPAPPAGVSRVTVVVPLTVPFQDVQIGSGPVDVPAAIDPTKRQLGQDRVFSVEVGSDGGTESADEDDSHRAVKLSSDVLFAINKSDLTSAATGILQDVAKQIDASTGTTVKVDGYTDNTGDDAINNPLSVARAQSVETALKRLVTRQGITYQAAGHGSRDPVADNGSADGRRKNRRVTVTFSLPVPKPAAPAATETSGVPFQWTKGDPQAIATGQFSNDEAKDLKVEINAVHRDASGLTTLVWTVRNTGSGHVSTGSALEMNWQLEGLMAPHRGSTDGGVLLVDSSSQVRFHTLQVADLGHCICPSLVGIDGAKTDLGPGESTTYFNVFKLLPATQTVDVQVPWSSRELLTIKGVPVK
jgi:outer membrane protein OmpA-like peptidoglycan-associated protein